MNDTSDAGMISQSWLLIQLCELFYIVQHGEISYLLRIIAKEFLSIWRVIICSYGHDMLSNAIPGGFSEVRLTGPARLA